MNRRNFLRAIGLGVAAVYLRLAPEKTQAVPYMWKVYGGPLDGETLLGYKGDQFLTTGYVRLPEYTPLYFTSDIRLSDFRKAPCS